MGSVVSLAQAQRIRKGLHRLHKVAVFTNGVFDLLHVGHVRYLCAARELGDVLFVGLNSDESTHMLKGPGRPIVPQLQRAELLCALSCVDYVIIFGDPSAEGIVGTLQPDIYVKGGDYVEGHSSKDCVDRAAKITARPAGETGKVPPEANVVRSYGGQVVILPHAPSHSTTEIIARILKSKAEQR